MAHGKRELKKYRRNAAYRKTALALAAALLAVAIVLLLLFTQVLAVVRYYGDGMEPGLSNGETLVLLRSKRTEQGDVIAFYYNNQLLVRRVIGEGGQQINIGEDGTVYINGEALAEPYLSRVSYGQCNISFPYYVPPEEIFVMGDDRAISMDSRLKEIGTITRDRIMGKLLFAW